MTRGRPKVPHTPPQPLVRDDTDLVTAAPLLWRVHRTTGVHVLSWDALRTWGPLPSMRWDPHPLPVGEHVDGVLYAAPALETALAEAFATTRMVDTASFDPHATAWRPTRHLRLLDLTGGWALRNHAANALSAAPRSTCRAWARVIRATWPDLDGLWTPSTMTGDPTVVLWSPAGGTFPASPGFSRPLGHPTVRAVIRAAATAIGYSLV
ncbi:MAG: RES family NAD+ phosphorylase [Marmoricola sp.]